MVCFSASSLFHVNYSLLPQLFIFFDLKFNVKQIIILDFEWMDTSIFY